jgi:hypothetical protein
MVCRVCPTNPREAPGLDPGAVHLLNRGVKRPERDVLIVREERPRAYLESLAGLFRSLTDVRVSIEGEYKVVIGDVVLSDVDVPKKFE